MACGLRDVAIQTARADFVNSRTRRTERRRLEREQLTDRDCVLLWQMGIRADEDIYQNANV